MKKDNKIEGIQWRATRFFMNDYNWESSVTIMMSQLKWEKKKTCNV